MEGRGKGDQEPRLRGRERGHGARVRILSRSRVPRGRGRVGRGRNSSASSAPDSPIPNTPTVQPSGTIKQNKHASLPLRCPNKDTPPALNFPPKHPFTEAVGPTKPLTASAKALDFFLQMFDQELMEKIE